MVSRTFAGAKLPISHGLVPFSSRPVQQHQQHSHRSHLNSSRPYTCTHGHATVPHSSNGQSNYVGVISPALLSPLSRGNITISSNDTPDTPIINLGWLTSQTDVDQSIISFKRCSEMWATSAMQNVTIGPEITPGANVTTDAEIEA